MHRAEADAMLKTKGFETLDAQVAVAIAARELAKAGDLEEGVSYFVESVLIPVLRSDSRIDASLQASSLADILREANSIP